jgi:hypothetical protein
MPDMLIRDVPKKTHTVLKRRAKGAGMSVQAYVLRLLEEHTERMTLDEWFDAVAKLRKFDDWVGAEAVRAAREELP